MLFSDEWVSRVVVSAMERLKHFRRLGHPKRQHDGDEQDYTVTIDTESVAGTPAILALANDSLARNPAGWPTLWLCSCRHLRPG